MKKLFLVLFTSIGLFQSVETFGQDPISYTSPKFREEWSKPNIYPDRIVLNFGQNPSSEVNVTWRTDTSIKQAYAQIAPATAAPKFWRNGQQFTAKTELLDAMQVENANLQAHYHSVEFKGLLPNTLYGYRVGDGEQWSEWFQFTTASDSDSEPFSFLYVGDAQNYVLELWSRLVREGFRKAPDAKFFIHAGDLINIAHRDQEWHEWFTAGGFIHSMIPSFPIPGNHEYRAKNPQEAEQKQRSLSVQWRPQFTLPLNGPKGLEETVYYMDYQDVRVIGLDSNRDHQIQAQWLEEVLAANPKKWTVVTYHHPLFSASNGRDNEALRNLWKPIFDKYRVDIALQGHDHAYARGRVAPGENVMDGVNIKDLTGTVYVVSVSGGKMYDIGDDWTAKGGQRDRTAENTQLFQVVTVDGNRLKFESYTAVGELYDAFELVKGENDLNQFIELRVNGGPENTHSNTIPYKD